MYVYVPFFSPTVLSPFVCVCAAYTCWLFQNVIIVLDVSGSMSQYGRLDLAKEAAETVISSL